MLLRRIRYRNPEGGYTEQWIDRTGELHGKPSRHPGPGERRIRYRIMFTSLYLVSNEKVPEPDTSYLPVCENCAYVKHKRGEWRCVRKHAWDAADYTAPDDHCGKFLHHIESPYPWDRGTTAHLMNRAPLPQDEPKEPEIAWGKITLPRPSRAPISPGNGR